MIFSGSGRGGLGHHSRTVGWRQTSNHLLKNKPVPRHDQFFFGTVFFLLGIISASVAVNGAVIIAFTAALIVLQIFINPHSRKIRVLAFLTIFIVVGNWYYRWDAARFTPDSLPFGEEIQLTGRVTGAVERYGESQRFTLRTAAPAAAKLFIYTNRYEKINLNDTVTIAGKILSAADGVQAAYFKKERIQGVITFAEIIEQRPSGKASISGTLGRFQEKVLSIYQRVFSPEKAAFLGGIMLGERGSFSEDFKVALNRSGTTHLIALSGYNITIISVAAAAAFGSFLRRRWAFAATIVVILGFVVMTGADPSIVRAAIMGFLVLLAHESARLYSPRNAIAFSALVMTILNPNILLFDIGFQLSFLALIGIIYLKPAIETYFRLSRRKSLLNWRENALTTISAQLMVLPILLTNFGQFSLAAFPANILILEAIPITMFFGLLVALIGLIALPLAQVVGLVTNALLSYEVFLIRFFSRFDFLLIQADELNIAVSLVYFGGVALFVAAMRRPLARTAI